MSTKLSCAIHAVADGQSWQLIPLYKELKQRGWDVDFIIDTERLSTSYPLIHEGIDWKLTAALNLDKPEKLYDVIVEYNPVIAPYLLKKNRDLPWHCLRRHRKLAGHIEVFVLDLCT